MLFIGIALVVAVALGLLVASDAGTLVGLSQNQFASAIALTLVLIIVAAGAFTRRQRLGTMLGNLLAWGAIVAIITVGYTYRYEINGFGNRLLGEFVPSAAVVDSENGTASFGRRPDGHFDVAADINGIRLNLLFDTGASAVVLSYADARKAGIDVADLRFTLPVTTANGTGRAAITSLDKMTIGGIVRSNVRAFVAEKGALDGSLLGMTFLETLSRYGVANNRLELAD